MIKMGIILMACMCSLIVKGQQGIEYSPRALDRELEKMYDIEELELKAIHSNDINGKFFLLTSKNKNFPVKYIYIGRVSTNNEYEYFDYFTLYDSTCKVQKVKVYKYQSSHGYQITADRWLQQFIGFGGSDTLKVGENIDAISGATISANAITIDIRDKTVLLKKMVQKTNTGF